MKATTLIHHQRGQRPWRALLAGLAASAIAGLLAAAPPAQANGVVVNDRALPPDAVRALEGSTQSRIAPGRYWYDAVSGAWGREGGPIAGQLQPGLPLGGRLRADASHGNTRVYVNGRELQLGEVMWLQQACRSPVHAGRYWVDARGVGGFEGRGPSFNLAACGNGSSQRRAGGSSTRTYCDSAGNCSSHGLWGWVGTVR